MSKRTLVVLAVGILALVGFAAQAPAVPMSGLMDGGTIEYGDKVFGDFDVSGPIDPASIDVTAVTLSNGDLALRFQGPFYAQDGGVADYGIYYSVSTATGEPLIKDISQSFVPTLGGTGGTIGIGESVYVGGFGGPGNPMIAHSSVSWFFGGSSNDPMDPPGEELQGDLLVFDPVSKVYVSKDILLVSNQGGLVGATVITQGFSQVPEPGTMLLLGSGLVGLGSLGLRRRRKQRA